MYGTSVIQWYIVLFAAVVATRSAMSTPDFVTEPNNTVVGEGLTTILTCSATTLGSLYTIQWQKDGTAFTNNGTVYDDRLVSLLGIPEPRRYTIISESDGEFNLQIVHAFKEDEGSFWCVINDPIGQLKASTHAKLTVETSSENYPRCVPNDLNDHYYEGDTLDVHCMFRNSEPLPVLKWHYSNTLLGGDAIYDSVPDISYHWQLHSSDNGKSIQCFANDTSSCSVGPVEVYYKPKQVAVSQHAEVVVGQPVVFSVSFDSNPSPSEYEWSLNGRIISRSYARFVIEGRTFRITNTFQSDAGTEVTCTVINIAGNATAHGTMRLLPLPATIKTTTEEYVSILTDTRDTSSFDPSQLERDSQQVEEFPVIVIAVTAGGASIFFIAIVLGAAVFLSSCREKRRKPQSGVVEANSMFQINMYNGTNEVEIPTTTSTLPPRQSYQQDAVSETSITGGYFGTNRRVHVKDVFSQVKETEITANNKQNEDNEQRCIGLSDTDTDYVVIENPSVTESPTVDPDIIQDTPDKSENGSICESDVKQSSAIADDISDVIIPDFQFLSDESSSEDNCETEKNSKEENIESDLIFVNSSVSEDHKCIDEKDSDDRQDDVEDKQVVDNTDTLPSGSTLMCVD